MNSKIWLGVLAVVLIVGGGVWAINKKSKPAINNNKMSTEEKMMLKEDKPSETQDIIENKAMPEDKSMASEKTMTTETPTDSMMKNDTMVQKHGNYKDYSPETVTNEQKAGQKIVLFFHAAWCPFCKNADSAFKTNTSGIPAGVTVLKTNYDSEKELKTKYGVTYQHTFVQIDTQGNQIAKWSGGDIEELKKNLK